MNKIILFATFLIGFSFACKKVDKLTKFNLNYEENVTIPSSTGINLPFNILSPDITTNSESSFSVNNTRKDLIESIKLTKLDLEIISPSNGNFNFLKSVDIYISADGLAETKIAYKENIPNNVGSKLSLDLTDTDLKEYIKKDKFSLKLVSVTDEFIATDYKIKISTSFFVDAKILGQ
ncbi:MAG: hypothetical protein K9I36_08920 [Bacteroidia bacterium]|nr:hypothetical protein [Bacteroidia bacterium]MCF8426840.1 hypothetical protein [Bacteroidia bacterium]